MKENKAPYKLVLEAKRDKKRIQQDVYNMLKVYYDNYGMMVSLSTKYTFSSGSIDMLHDIEVDVRVEL